MRTLLRLAKAWTYDIGVPASGYTITRDSVVNNVMYLPVQGSTIGALKADAGHRVVEIRSRKDPGLGPNPSAGGRGISYWPGTPETRPRIVIATTNGFLVQLDAKTGVRVVGPSGVVNLATGRGRVRRQLLDEHGAWTRQESGDHRRRVPANKAATGFLVIRGHSI